MVLSLEEEKELWERGCLIFSQQKLRFKALKGERGRVIQEVGFESSFHILPNTD